ncbi:MAG: hypothetical protein JW940_06705 [Polyangiaceae bacterium]|nr:hypothetical protein [Polyangiaceae bacterium]
MKRFHVGLCRCLLLGAATAGCAGDRFDPFNRLNSLRVLAIQSDPVAPAPGESTTLSALLFVPKGQSQPVLTWSWCPFPGSAADGYPCTVDEKLFAGPGGQLALPPLELGTGDSVPFEHSIPGELLSTLCAGVAEMPELVVCDGGFPVQVKLHVKTDKDELVAVRTLRLRTDEQTGANENPVIEGVSARLGGKWHELGEAADATLPRDEVTKLKASVAEDQAEQYVGLDDYGKQATLQERLRMTWFIESGDTENEHTGFIDGLTDFEVLLDNSWIPANKDDYSRDASELILVLRDNRDGVSWHRVTVGLEDKP